ncbi:MAG: hypothetical protein ACC662_05625 [Planctomycetota bacterium]
MTTFRDEFLSEEDLDLRHLSEEELLAWWDLWLRQAQATNDLDEHLYSHGVFTVEPAPASHPARSAPTRASRADGGGIPGITS